MLTTFLAACDSTIISSATPAIQRDLKGSTEAYSWVGESSFSRRELHSVADPSVRLLQGTAYLCELTRLPAFSIRSHAPGRDVLVRSLVLTLLVSASVTVTALCPVYGKVSDLLGRKPVLYTSIIVFMAGSALCGAAKSMIWLCAARGVQGLGGGGILQVSGLLPQPILW